MGQKLKYSNKETRGLLETLIRDMWANRTTLGRIRFVEGIVSTGKDAGDAEHGKDTEDVGGIRPIFVRFPARVPMRNIFWRCGPQAAPT